MRLKTVCSFFLNPLNGIVYLAFPQPSCSSVCDFSEICVSYIEQPFNVWYVWVFLLLLLIVIVRCVAACCLQCWIKKQASFSSRKMFTVVTLSSSDALCVTESSQCLHSQAWTPHQTLEARVSSITLGGLESGAPPSYEELFSRSKF